RSCMRVRGGLLLILLCLTLAAGCGAGLRMVTNERTIGEDRGGGTGSETTSGEIATFESSMESTVGAVKEAEVMRNTTAASTGVNEKEAGSLGEGPFTASPVASGGANLDADSILAVRHGDHDGYERVVVDFGTGAKPAGSVPEWTLDSPTGDGLLRVSFPSVSATRVSDGDLGEGILRDFHVVRGPEGGMFADFFATGAFTYRVRELIAPARLVVDFKSSEMPLGRPLPAEGGKTVLTQPREGELVGSPLTVSGYSRNFEAANTIVLTDAGGEVVARKSVPANDWSVTWGYFEATLDAPSFSGQGTLRVGSGSARDGSFEGVEIPIRGRQR
ncbi:MAG TPA: Gmad2 immunoglobulin-like domain-containing protein, partial [Rubrobacteraceae bacterium]|nr:Gmad2 immunoglobulin-like domain-containing protein [Rubrobacteraceae bacterium]